MARSVPADQFAELHGKQILYEILYRALVRRLATIPASPPTENAIRRILQTVVLELEVGGKADERFSEAVRESFEAERGKLLAELD
ncbi:hypothetical protein [Candidatus Palauibacter sp.]|uniref:hypothetical protein n=1 Tax=Candidatus Palauibacter sp. TaxID=3101350 RepID=UPI003B523E52